MKINLIIAYRKLLRVAFVIFHRIYIVGGFLRPEYVRRRGGGEFSQVPRRAGEGRARAKSGQTRAADGEKETK